jgi:uncharacterized protein (TIRG00374 family)
MNSAGVTPRESVSQSTVLPVIRKLIFGLVLGFVVFVGLVLFGDLRAVSQVVQGFHWPYFFLALLLVLWNYSLRFIKWNYFLKQIDVKNLPLSESARIFVAGFPLAVTPGKIGETLKAVWLQRRSGVPVPRGISVVLAERISDGLAMLGLSAFGVIAYPGYWPAFAAVLALLFSVLLISQVRPLALYLIDVGERLPLGRRFSHALRELYEGSYNLFRPRSALLSVILGGVSWAAEGIALFVILIGLGVPASLEAATVSIFALSFSTVIGAVSALPGGLLTTDASIAGMLVLLLGLDLGTAAAATLLIRLATLWFAVALGIAVWLFSGEMLGLSQSKEYARGK